MRHPQTLCDLGARHPQPAQCRDRHDPLLGCAMRDHARRRAAIVQPRLALLAKTTQPPRERTHTHTSRLGSPSKRPTLLLDPANRQTTTTRTCPRVTVQLHPEPSLALVASTPPSLQGEPDGTTLLGLTPRPRFQRAPTGRPEPDSAICVIDPLISSRPPNKQGHNEQQRLQPATTVAAAESKRPRFAGPFEKRETGLGPATLSLEDCAQTTGYVRYVLVRSSTSGSFRYIWLAHA